MNFDQIEEYISDAESELSAADGYCDDADSAAYDARNAGEEAQTAVSNAQTAISDANDVLTTLRNMLNELKTEAENEKEVNKVDPAVFRQKVVEMFVNNHLKGKVILTATTDEDGNAQIKSVDHNNFAVCVGIDLEALLIGMQDGSE